ncbi:MAG: cation:dicarboxylase symporter family transporter, partial [Ignavibacteria bacterium]|nr:cation:dicarboxylase symporter family transporter [Ignavibacteria bacterium]
MKKFSSHTLIIIALAFGALVGTLVNISAAGNPNAQQVLNTLIDSIAHPIGQIFLRLLFIVVVPLVFASLTSGVAGLGDISKLGKIGGRTLLFFLITSAFAAFVGITLLELVKPGAGFDQTARETLMNSYASQTKEIGAKTGTAVASGTLGIVNQILDMFVPRNIIKSIVNMEMIPLIVFSLLFGTALTKIAEEK